MGKDVTYVGGVIYLADDINGERRHLCSARHGCVGNVIYDQHVTYGQKRHVWTARRLRGKAMPGSARVPPWAVVSDSRHGDGAAT
jgi:hypothetical protein